MVNDADRAIGIVIHFNHPTYGVPCVAGWDEEGEVLLFDFEDYDAAIAAYEPDKVEKVRQWCMMNGQNCGTKDQANTHLAFLDIKTEF